MRTHAATILLTLLTLVGGAARADYSGHARSPELLERLQRDFGFSAAELQTVKTSLINAQRLPQLVEQEQKAPEKTQTWTQYSKRVNDARVRGGLKLLQTYPAEFARAEEQFGVPPHVIAGILGVETHYGVITGKIRVLDSLATQGFDHPTRWPFFFDELTEFFAFCRDFGIAPEQPTGSYAGAMGAAQFMPSNYRWLALDYDGDGRRDLWKMPDAIGSIANYFTHYRPALSWKRGEPLMVRARVTQPLPPQLERNSKSPVTTVAALRQAGIVPEVALPPDTPVGLVELPLDDGTFEYWMGLHNFYSVMTYNPRIFYAMAVSQLAQRITEAQSPP